MLTTSPLNVACSTRGAFPERQPSTFASAMMMPLMSDTMNLFDTMLPFKLTRSDDEEDQQKEEEAVEAQEIAAAEEVAAAMKEEEEDAALAEKVEALMPFEVPSPRKRFSMCAARWQGYRMVVRGRDLEG